MAAAMANDQSSNESSDISISLSSGGTTADKSDDCEFDGDTPKSEWISMRNDVRSLRQKLWSVIGQRVPTQFIFNHVVGTDGEAPFTRVYFMSTPTDSRDTRVFGISVPDNAPPLSLLTSSTVRFPWNLTLASTESTRTLSKEEQLLFERKRKKTMGISWYEFDKTTSRFLFSSGSQLYQASVDDAAAASHLSSTSTEPLQAHDLPPTASGGSRINAEMCPLNADLIAYVCSGDLWVAHTSKNVDFRLTSVHQGADVQKYPISAGFPSYIMQEEFDRYKGFWWQPKSEDDGVLRILYEEVDESQVKIVNLFSHPDGEPETYRFPAAGTPNAKSELKLMELRLPIDDEGDLTFKESTITFPIEQYFSWTEYIVRVGWTPDGRFVWAQLLDRTQSRIELVLFPVMGKSSTTPPFYVIYSEVTNLWINVNDLLTFIPPNNTSNANPNRVQFIWATEETGFCHLNFIESELRPCIHQSNGNGGSSEAVSAAAGVASYHLSPNILRKVALTRGEWEVMDLGALAINHEKQFIFFHGLRDSPVEKHIYVVSYHDNTTSASSAIAGSVRGAGGDTAQRRLTEPGCSYVANFNSDCTLVAFTYSNTTTPPVCKLFRVLMPSAAAGEVGSIVLEPLTCFLPPIVRDPAFASPEISTHQLKDAPTIYAMIFKPSNFDPDKTYPTILNVYGGPHVQMVHNSFRGTEQYWIHLLASQGYCIVNIDSRGSYHRGIKFEAHLKDRMGTVELKDQVEVLEQLVHTHHFIDPQRLGIFGWSYGGYLSLMGLLHFSHVFKVAVAGAPVCTWNLYDTGYTERYMGTPASNPSGYQDGSVLNYISLFPDEENRLLIFHGLLDENVHFFHTAKLISALIAAGKPHQIQVYPTERHSLRTWEASEHFETTFLCFLRRCL